MSSAQGTSARFVILAILGKWRVWRKIQTLYMRFVILKLRNPLLCTMLLYIMVSLLGSWDEITSLKNLGLASQIAQVL
jgi:uncharacterized membrane protein